MQSGISPIRFKMYSLAPTLTPAAFLASHNNVSLPLRRDNGTKILEVTLFDSHSRSLSLHFLRRSSSIASVAALLIISATALRAEDPPDAPIPQTQTTSATGTQSSQPAAPIKGGAFPHYFVIEPGEHPPPMTVGDKFHGYVRQQLGFTTLLSASVGAAISQGLDSDPKWGQGWEAYGERVGDAMIGSESSAFLREAVIPSVLHQDPRYYRRGSGSFAHRAFYAASRTIITRQDSGSPSFNFSVVGASGAAEGLTYLYYPDSNRSGLQSFGAVFTRIGGVAITNVLHEFSPDLKRKFLHRNQ